MSGPRLTGQIALVTGAGRGIGRAFAAALAAEGAVVALVARSAHELSETADLVRAVGGRALSITADLADPGAIELLVPRVTAELGPIDLLVNNAAVATPLGPLTEVDPVAWWRCLEVNLRAPMLLSRAVIPAMRARRSGRIVNIASMVATAAVANLSAYGVSKAALLRLTETVAAEERLHGIRVFSLEPGTVRTAMTESVLGSEAGRKHLGWFKRLFDQGQDVPAEQAAALLIEIAAGRADALTGRLLVLTDGIDRVLAESESVMRQDLYTLRLKRLPDARG